MEEGVGGGVRGAVDVVGQRGEEDWPRKAF